MADIEESKMQDPNAEFYVKIEFGRQAMGSEEQAKAYLTLEYPNLNYGNMVAIQNIMYQTALKDLVDMGKAMAKSMGQDVPDREFIKQVLENPVVKGKK
jgi:hypothetical protein